MNYLSFADDKDILYTLKVLFLGDESVMKQRKTMIWRAFKRDQHAVPPAEMNWEYKQPVEINNRTGQLLFENYDNSISQEQSYIPFQGVYLLLLVFDYKNDSFQNIDKWYEQAKRFCNNKEIITMIVGVSSEMTQQFEVPQLISEMISEEKRIHYFNLTLDNTDKFLEEIEKHMLTIRTSILTNETIDEKIEKNKKFLSNIDQQSAISRKTISEQKKIIVHDDNKDKMISYTEKGLSVQIKTLLLGDKCMTEIQRKFAVGYTTGWETDFKQYGFDDIPEKKSSDERREICLKMNVFEHVSGKGQANTPWINCLAVMLCFDYENNESFSNLMKWYNDSVRYCNIKSVRFVILGFNKKEECNVKEEDLNAFIKIFPQNKQPLVLTYDETKHDEIESQLKQFYTEVVESNYPTEYLEDYKRIHPLEDKKKEKKDEKKEEKKEEKPQEEAKGGCVLL